MTNGGEKRTAEMADGNYDTDRRGFATLPASPSLRVAYADPPYIGVAHRYPEKTEVNHEELIVRLESEFPDGWALSASCKSLQFLLSHCPETVRVAVWVKPWYSLLPSNPGPQYTWEPVLYRGGRRRTPADRSCRDSLIANAAMRQKVLGQKPPIFSRWLFELLNLRASDEFVDIYPGSGAVLKAWRAYQADSARLPLQLEIAG